MTCNITSTVDTGGLQIPVSTPVNQLEGDSVNIAQHTRDVANTSGVGQGQSIGTTWPGLPAPVVTTRRQNESTDDWLIRHRQRLNSAAAANPIDCP